MNYGVLVKSGIFGAGVGVGAEDISESSGDGEMAGLTGDGVIVGGAGGIAGTTGVAGAGSTGAGDTPESWVLTGSVLVCKSFSMVSSSA